MKIEFFFGQFFSKIWIFTGNKIRFFEKFFQLFWLFCNSLFYSQSSGKVGIVPTVAPARLPSITPVNAKTVVLSLRQRKVLKEKAKLEAEGKVVVIKKRRKKSRETRKSMFDEELDKYETYEQYLDSLVSEEDHKYLQDEEMARAIAELGYR